MKRVKNNFVEIPSLLKHNRCNPEAITLCSETAYMSPARCVEKQVCFSLRQRDGLLFTKLHCPNCLWSRRKKIMPCRHLSSLVFLILVMIELLFLSCLCVVCCLSLSVPLSRLLLCSSVAVGGTEITI